MFDPLVSIIIPVYNSELYIKNCIESIQNNNYDNIEIICINDGSTDKSLEVLTELAKNDTRIKVINQDNMGVACARNKAFEQTTGKYLFNVDSDDVISDKTISTCVKYLEENNVDLIFFNLYHKYKDRTTDKIFDTKYFGGHLTICEAKDNDYAGDISFSTTCLIKKDFLEKYNIRFPENLIYEDISYMADIFTKNPKCIFLDEPFYEYRIYEDRNHITQDVSEKSLCSIENCKIAYNKIHQTKLNQNWEFLIDKKLVFGSVWFIIEKIYKSKNKKILKPFCKKLCSELKKYEPLYFQSLISNTSLDIRILAESLYYKQKLINNFIFKLIILIHTIKSKTKILIKHIYYQYL